MYYVYTVMLAWHTYGGDLWRSGLAPVSAAGNECAAGSEWFEPQSRQEIFRLV
jgi:hypothetical protein